MIPDHHSTNAIYQHRFQQEVENGRPLTIDRYLKRALQRTAP
jgi:hypothetical protein